MSILVNFKNYTNYRTNLMDVPGIHTINYDDRECCNYQYVIIEVDEAVTGISRDDMVSVLHAENVLARRYFFPGCHEMEPYRSFFPHAGLLLPETKRLSQRVMSLPTGTALGQKEIDAICNIIKLAVTKSHDLLPMLDSIRVNQ